MNEILISMLPTLSVLATLGIGLVALRIVDWVFERKVK